MRIMMSDDLRLNESQLLAESHFPVVGVFFGLRDNVFVRVIQGIAEGHGFGVNYGACIFPDDLDEYEIATNGTFDGVEFGLHNGEDVILDYATFYYYLDIICRSFTEDYPEHKEEVEAAKAAYRARYRIDVK